MRGDEVGYLTPKKLKLDKPRCECWTKPQRWRPTSERCPYAAAYQLEDGTKVCGNHAAHPTPTHAWAPDPDAVQRAADVKAARRVLADFENRGGTTLDELRRELGLIN